MRCSSPSWFPGCEGVMYTKRSDFGDFVIYCARGTSSTRVGQREPLPPSEGGVGRREPPPPTLGRRYGAGPAVNASGEPSGVLSGHGGGARSLRSRGVAHTLITD